MFCSNCGKELKEGARFCSECGAQVKEAAAETVTESAAAQGNVAQGVAQADSTAENVSTQAESAAENAGAQAEEAAENTGAQAQQFTQQQDQQTFGQGNAQQSTAQASAPSDKKIVLQIVAGIFAVVYAFSFLGGFFGGIGSAISDLFKIKYYGVVDTILMIIGDILDMACGAVALVIAATLLLFIVKWTKENSEKLLVTLAELAVLRVAIVLVEEILLAIRYAVLRYSFGFYLVSPILKTLLYGVVVVGIIYGILYLLGVTVRFTFTKEALLDAPKSTWEILTQYFNESKEKKAQNTQNAAGQTGAAENPYAQTYAQGTGNYLKTDRSLLMYILLSIVTCGIYSWYFLYSIARDVNEVCEGDGKKTPGLLKFILLSMITCGIYSWVWYYNLGNRLQENAPRYGLQFSENGTSVLIWLIFGSFLCGIGAFIAMNILIKNTNAICAAYNQRNGQMA